jgi:hypothetical protein
MDAEGAVWYADVGNRHCVRIREGGEVLATVGLDRGAFACALSRGPRTRGCLSSARVGADPSRRNLPGGWWWCSRRPHREPGDLDPAGSVVSGTDRLSGLLVAVAMGVGPLHRGLWPRAMTQAGVYSFL